jgi:hypothetical protein
MLSIRSVSSKNWYVFNNILSAPSCLPRGYFEIAPPCPNKNNCPSLTQNLSTQIYCNLTLTTVQCSKLTDFIPILTSVFIWQMKSCASPLLVPSILHLNLSFVFQSAEEGTTGVDCFPIYYKGRDNPYQCLSNPPFLQHTSPLVYSIRVTQKWPK